MLVYGLVKMGGRCWLLVVAVPVLLPAAVTGSAALFWLLVVVAVPVLLPAVVTSSAALFWRCVSGG